MDWPVDMGKSVKSSFMLTVVLLGVWLLLSGHYNPLMIGFGIISCLLVVLLSYRMRIVDEEGAPVDLGLRPFIFYAPWLLKEIVVANFDVAGRILNPRLPIQPTLISVRASQKGELARVIYANSITLTPGTVSVGMERDTITVHALSHEEALEDGSGEMDRRVSALERIS